MFIAIAIHHAAAEHAEEFVAFMHRVIVRTQGAPGLLEFKACRSSTDAEEGAHHVHIRSVSVTDSL